MDTLINTSIVEKVVTKKVAILKAISMLPPPPFEDKFATKETLCQTNENTQKTNSERCLNEPEQKTEQLQNDTMNETKTESEQESWRTITDPKLRTKMRKTAWRKANPNSDRDYWRSDAAKEKRRLWRKSNPEKVKAMKRREYEKNKDHIKNRVKAYYEANKDARKAYYKSWKEKNKQCIADYHHNWQQENKLACNLRKRLRLAIKGNFKAGSAVKDLGCTIDELKVYLSSKFQPGMTWDNWGQYGWHIDHIRPLASFDLTDRKQLLEACHYTNLQPLWWQDNLTKGDRQ